MTVTGFNEPQNALMVVDAISSLTGLSPDEVLQELTILCGGDDGNIGANLDLDPKDILARMDARWGATSKLLWQRVTTEPDASWDGAQLLGHTVRDAS